MNSTQGMPEKSDESSSSVTSGHSTHSRRPPSASSGGHSTPGSASGGCPSCRQLVCSCVNVGADRGSTKGSPHSSERSTSRGEIIDPSLIPTSAAGVLSSLYGRLPTSATPSSLYNPSTYSSDQAAAYLAAVAAASEHSALSYGMTAGGMPDGSGKDGGGLGPSNPWGYPSSLYHPYEYAAAAAAAAAYPFNGYAMDVNGSRRKNATRETTSTLKAWLNEHKKNPYPTKGEKIMLAIITKMTLTQVSTWFANARRRLKKENKMTWEPRTRPEDDEDVDVSEDESDKKEQDNERLGSGSGPPNTRPHHLESRLGHDQRHNHGKISPAGSSCSDGSKDDTPLSMTSRDTPKPRIWSLADFAGSGGGGGGGGGGGNHHMSNSGNSGRSTLPGSAFSPLTRTSHSESLYRGLYPHPLSAHHHHHLPPSVYGHPDNP